MKQSIQFGLMCDSFKLAKWQVKCLEELLSLNYVKLTLIIKNDCRLDTKLKGKLSKLRPYNILYGIYSVLLLKTNALKMLDIKKLIKGVPIIHCKINKKEKYFQYFSYDDIKEIQQKRLDFVLRFGFNIIKGEILNVARYGVWSFHHGDEEKYRGVPPGFWEIYYDDDTTGSILQRLTDRLDGGIILKKGCYKTIKRSYAKNLNNIYMNSTIWPKQVCIDILNSKEAIFDKAPSKTKAKVFHHPKNLQMIYFTGKIIRNILKEIYYALFKHEVWNIGIVDKPINNFLKTNEIYDVKWFAVKNNKKFIADPFILNKNGQYYLFCEEFNYKKQKGSLTIYELDTKGFPIKKLYTTDEKYHQSYPFVLQFNSEWYCIPETYQLNEIALYKIDIFSKSFHKVSTLVSNFPGLDPTIFKFQDLFYLTCTNFHEGGNSKLCIWYANDLFGKWKPHANNPVKIDISSARPAGNPFEYKGNLYRPAQDCSKKYGYGITINKVKKLSPTEFNEEMVSYIIPNREYPDGIHTIAQINDELTIIDGKKLKFKYSTFLYNLSRIIRLDF